jgi:hypothetical protein
MAYMPDEIIYKRRKGYRPRWLGGLIAGHRAEKTRPRTSGIAQGAVSEVTPPATSGIGQARQADTERQRRRYRPADVEARRKGMPRPPPGTQYGFVDPFARPKGPGFAPAVQSVEEQLRAQGSPLRPTISSGAMIRGRRQAEEEAQLKAAREEAGVVPTEEEQEAEEAEARETEYGEWERRQEYQAEERTRERRWKREETERRKAELREDIDAAIDVMGTTPAPPGSTAWGIKNEMQQLADERATLQRYAGRGGNMALIRPRIAETEDRMATLGAQLAETEERGREAAELEAAYEGMRAEAERTEKLQRQEEKEHYTRQVKIAQLRATRADDELNDARKREDDLNQELTRRRLELAKDVATRGGEPETEYTKSLTDQIRQIEKEALPAIRQRIGQLQAAAANAQAALEGAIGGMEAETRISDEEIIDEILGK